jgi:hypothetical protein
MVSMSSITMTAQLPTTGQAMTNYLFVLPKGF